MYEDHLSKLIMKGGRKVNPVMIVKGIDDHAVFA
jgi:hypothetical protein